MLRFIKNIQRKLMKLRLQPIRVFCFHQVSETFDESTMYMCDWTQIDQFKRNVLRLKEQYSLISIQEANGKLKHDRYRYKKYAVLTADDGWKSLTNILPWLAEQQIPITLFVNPAYLKGEETRENSMSSLLSWDELNSILKKYPNITIASHGWNHILVTELEDTVFQEEALNSVEFLKQSNRLVSFYAYPCGRHNKRHDDYLNMVRIVPVYMDGMKNYSYEGGIHRELLDGLNL